MRRFAPLLILLLILTSCGGKPAGTPFDPTQGKSDPVILASTTFLADIARNVAGDRLHVDSIFPIGVDPHSFQPVPQDVVKMSEADLLIFVGAGYETFERILVENSGGKGIVIEASTGLQHRPAEGVEGSRTEALDPHFWLDPNHVIVFVENIREGLTHFDPDGAAVYQSNADAYVGELKNLDAWINERVSHIPPERKLLITNHEALGYFADRYGFTIVGTVIESFSTDASPSAHQLAALIDQINASGAPAIFLDASDNPTLPQQIADETNVIVVTDLHLESLTDGAPAATYIDMMKHNVTQIVNALQ